MKRDDASRLVWADALLERGDPRGELITAQCALARGGLPRDASLRLRRREMALLEEVPGLEGLADGWSWTKGAIEEISIRADTFLRHRAELFERAPLLHRLRLHDLPTDVGDATSLLVEVLEDGHIDGLTLGTKNDPAILTKLDAMGYLPRLRAIELQGLPLGAALRNDGLRNLEDLVLTNLVEPFSHPMSEESALRPHRLRLQSPSQQKEPIALESLAPTDFFSRLDDLSLDWFVRPNVVVRSRADLLDRLRRLRMPMGLASAPLSLAVVPARLPRLEELSLAFFGREEEIDLGPLVEGASFPALRVLRIGAGLTVFDKVRELVRSPLGRTLEVLDLRQNRWHLERGDLDWDGILLT